MNDAVLELIKPAETKLEVLCFIYTDFRNGILHQCDKCPLKRTSCILYALKNAIKESEGT